MTRHLGRRQEKLRYLEADAEPLVETLMAAQRTRTPKLPAIGNTKSLIPGPWSLTLFQIQIFPSSLYNPVTRCHDDCEGCNGWNKWTWAFGASALDTSYSQVLGFCKIRLWKWKFLFIHEKTFFYWIQAKTTRWTRGSIESVAYVSNNGHGGGYTYRYRKIGSFSFHPSILLPANTIELFFFMPSVYNFHHNIRMSQGTPL